MKKPLTLFAIAIASLASCKKKECYYCTTTQTFSGNTGLSPIVTSTSVCDLTKNDARDYEKENSSTTSTSLNGEPVTVTKHTVCE